MPKEADHLEDGGDKESKEERTQDASEEMVRKRVRANTPSPHRGNTPQGEKRVEFRGGTPTTQNNRPD